MKYSINTLRGAVPTDGQTLKATQICGGIVKMLGDFATHVEVVNVTYVPGGMVHVYLTFLHPSFTEDLVKVKVDGGMASRYMEERATSYIILDVVRRTRAELNQQQRRMIATLLPFVGTSIGSLDAEFEKIRCTHVANKGGENEHHCTNAIANFTEQEPVEGGDVYCVVCVKPDWR